MSSSSVRKGVAASPDVLEQYHVDHFESVDPTSLISTSGIKYRGWTFSTTHGKIANEAEGLVLCQTISDRCGAERRQDDVILLRTTAGGENHLHTPPMLFPHDSLVLAYHPSAEMETETETSAQTRLEFTVLDALSCWALQHRDARHVSCIPAVPYAHKWQQPSSAPTVPDENNKEEGGSCIGTMKCQEWDWTYSTPYSCTTHVSPEQGGALVSHMMSGGVSLPLPSAEEDSRREGQRQWRACAGGGLDTTLLRRHDPILFFDEVLLYQDDLEDCGESTFDVKLRVMPACWFVLARLFSRVDGGRLVMRETRLFHEFGSDRVTMELTWKECLQSHFNLQQPVHSGRQMPPFPPPGVSGAISSSQLRDANVMSSLMPVVPALTASTDGEDGDSESVSSVSNDLRHGALSRPVCKDFSLNLASVAR